MIIPKRSIVIQTDSINLQSLQAGIDQLGFRECLKSMEESWGFFSADENNEAGQRLLTVNRFTVINLRHDRKKLNKTRLSRAWRAEVQKQEKAAEMRFDKARKDEVREQVKKTLLESVLPDETYIKAVYDSLTNRLFVLVSEAKTAEFFIEKLNKALEKQNLRISFSADGLSADLADTLTQWVATPEKAKEQGFEVGDDMQLKGAESSTATLKHHEAESAEVREHLHAGKDIYKLKLILSGENEEAISFVITPTRIISQLDLKAICAPKVKSERENHSDVEAMRESELLIWMSALNDLWEKISVIELV